MAGVSPDSQKIIKSLRNRGGSKKMEVQCSHTLVSWSQGHRVSLGAQPFHLPWLSLTRFPPYSHLPSVLFAEENTTGPKRCQLPEALAALLSSRQILHVQHVPKCTEPCPESLATGPGSGSEAEETIIGLNSKLLFQCFQSLVVSKETSGCAGVLKWKKLEWKAGARAVLSPGWARDALPAVGSQQGSLMAGHTRSFKSTSKPKWEMERTRWIVD